MRGSYICFSNLLVTTYKSKWILPAKTAASHWFLQLKGCAVKHLQWLCSPKLLKSFPRFWDLNNCIVPGLSLRAGGRGFSPATKRVAPGYFYWKIEPKEIPSRLTPRLLVVFTRQLEILVTTL